MSAKKLSGEYICQHPYFTARKDSYQLESGKIVDPYFLVELPPCALAMGLTHDNKVIMVKQYRYPVNQELLELPGGFIDAGESPDQAVKRELLEETGYVFSEYRYLGYSAANPGVLNNITHFFLALNGEFAASQSLDPNEQIEIQLYELEEVKEMLFSNKILQSLHALCLFYGFRELEK